MMVARLTKRQIRYAVISRKSGRSTSVIASELKVTPRRIQQLYSEFCSTGLVHVPLRPARHRLPATQNHTAALWILQSPK